jgi:chorismate mutase
VVDSENVLVLPKTTVLVQVWFRAISRWKKLTRSVLDREREIAILERVRARFAPAAEACNRSAKAIVAATTDVIAKLKQAERRSQRGRQERRRTIGD